MINRRVVIGVDPGGRYTGIVVRHQDTLCYTALVKRETPLDWYLGEVVDTVEKARDVAKNILLAETPNLITQPTALAVEDLNPPTPQMGMTSVQGLLETAQVIGAISGKYPITRIPPGQHGNKPLTAYPGALVHPSEEAGRGRYRHLRAAWDIAQAAQLHLAAQEAAG